MQYFCDISYIYTLVDPRNCEVRYIGKSNRPHERLKGHLNEARRGCQTEKGKWISLLLLAGTSPRLVILKAASSKFIYELERQCISMAEKSYGKKLTNRKSTRAYWDHEPFVWQDQAVYRIASRTKRHLRILEIPAL